MLTVHNEVFAADFDVVGNGIDANEEEVGHPSKILENS